MRSDLQLEWMGPETKVCHSALNQLSYFLLQKRKELATHLIYNTPHYYDKSVEFLSLRKKILYHLYTCNVMEKQQQKFLLMADESGI
jgi:hypothetical protein